MYYSSIWFWEEFSSGQLNDMIDSLPLFRKEKALSYVFDRDRLLCAKSYMMLSDLLKEKYGIYDKPDFEFGPHGKPYLLDSDKFFNLSHCPKGILCVVGDEEIGCDVEEIVPDLDMDLCRMCFNEKEQDHILSSPQPTVEFTRLWTRKEAYLKLTGEGLSDSLPDILSESVLSRVNLFSSSHMDKGCESTIAIYKKDSNSASNLAVIKQI